ncbi:hypothetical protein [Sphingomonas sp.]|jgi:hypothetical protein|uniref:hypothetical protein n=1 Tax=Sphingomonas sp. TaxID=28214 RepID=UPI002ED8DF09
MRSFRARLRASSAVIAGGYTPAPTLNAVRAVASTGRIATGTQALGTDTKFRQQLVEVVRSGCTYQEWLFPLWHADEDSVTKYTPLPAGAVAACQFYRPASTTRVDGKVNGQASSAAVRIAVDGSGLFITCRVDASQFGFVTFPIGDVLRCMLEIDGPAGMTLPVTDKGGIGGAVSGEGLYYGGTTSMGINSLAANGGTSQVTRIWRPAAIIGDGNVKAFAAIGDSNWAGKGGSKPSGDGSSAQHGFAAKGLYDLAVPFSILGQNGDRAEFWNGVQATDPRYQLLRYFDIVWMGLATNDVATNSSDVNAVVPIANHRGVRAKIASIPLPGGGARTNTSILAATIPPRTSNSGYTSTAAENISAGFGAAPSCRAALNAAILADAGVLNLGAVWDLASIVADTVDPNRIAILDALTPTANKVQTGGVANSMEVDGTHWSQNGNAYIAPSYTAFNQPYAGAAA